MIADICWVKTWNRGCRNWATENKFTLKHWLFVSQALFSPAFEIAIGQQSFWSENLKVWLYNLQIYQFRTLTNEMWNTKHVVEIKLIDEKCLFCWNETKIKSVKDPSKLQVETCRRNQSKSTRGISSVNKYPELAEKILHRYTSTSSTASQYCLWSFHMDDGLIIYQTKYCRTTLL